MQQRQTGTARNQLQSHAHLSCAAGTAVSTAAHLFSSSLGLMLSSSPLLLPPAPPPRPPQRPRPLPRPRPPPRPPPLPPPPSSLLSCAGSYSASLSAPAELLDAAALPPAAAAIPAAAASGAAPPAAAAAPVLLPGRAAASAVPLLERLTPAAALLAFSRLLSRPPCMLIMSSCSCTGGEVNAM